MTCSDAVDMFFSKQQVDCVINCAGYTAVDLAEEDMAGASALNVRAARLLAEATARSNALLLHVSTDYVFDGTSCRPYTEGDTANPRSVYGKTKLDGELEVIFNAKRSVIIRTSWLYGKHGHNFVNTVLGKAEKGEPLKVVCDQVGTPTSTVDLAHAIMEILPGLPPRIRGEIYNYSNEGVASWYDVAQAIVELKGFNARVEPVYTKEMPVKAARPPYSVLNKSRIKKEFGLKIPHWRESLRKVLIP